LSVISPLLQNRNAAFHNRDAALSNGVRRSGGLGAGGFRSTVSNMPSSRSFRRIAARVLLTARKSLGVIGNVYMRSVPLTRHRILPP
jgi:hypothetical protein